MSWFKILLGALVLGVLFYLYYKWKSNQEVAQTSENIKNLESKLESEIETQVETTNLGSS
jgi:hypothetical protein